MRHQYCFLLDQVKLLGTLTVINIFAHVHCDLLYDFNADALSPFIFQILRLNSLRIATRNLPPPIVFQETELTYNRYFPLNWISLSCWSIMCISKCSRVCKLMRRSIHSPVDGRHRRINNCCQDVVLCPSSVCKSEDKQILFCVGSTIQFGLYIVVLAKYSCFTLNTLSKSKVK